MCNKILSRYHLKKCLVAVTGSFVAGIGLFIFFTNITILSYRHTIVDRFSQIPTTTVAMIFGGGMKPDGSVSDMAGERLKVGIDLYQKGLVEKLLITGDDGAFRVNEVDEMKRVAIRGGVLEGDIIVDGHGYRTYESCYRAQNFYHLDNAIAVSQMFHLPRIAFLCEHFGVRVIGVSAEFNVDWYGWSRNTIREILSRVKNWFDVKIYPPAPPLDLPYRNVK